MLEKMDVQEDNVAAEDTLAAGRESWGWTRKQRAGLGILLFILLALLTVQFLRRPARLDDPKVIVDGRAVTLPVRMDPNTATLEELARIPHLGETLAGKIVAYRSARAATAADGIVFHQLGDLDAVPGIGKKVLEQIEPFLAFPGAASQPE